MYDQQLRKLDSKFVYGILINDKIQLPVGMLHWCCDLEISDIQISTAFTFAHKCSQSVFDRVFQYKIATQILPTNDYLNRYRVKDTNICDKCSLEFDSIEHSLYSCSELTKMLRTFFQFLKTNCGVSVHIGMVEYLLGFSGMKNIGLNHVLLELKKSVFYSWNSNIDSDAFCDQVKCNIKRIMVKEKLIMIKNNKYEDFNVKWNDFVQIYDFRGPDFQL